MSIDQEHRQPNISNQSFLKGGNGESVFPPRSAEFQADTPT